MTLPLVSANYLEIYYSSSRVGKMRSQWCFTVLASITFFSLLIHSQPDKDAGNLNPSEEGSKITDGTVPVPFGSNHSESSIPGDSVRVVRASMSNGLNDDSFSEAAKDEQAVGDREEERQGEVRKAPRPVGTAESVGYVPKPEEKKTEEVLPAPEKDNTVRFIPSLPPSIIQPGRMLNGSWYIVLYAPWCEFSQLVLVEFIPTVQYIVDNNITNMVVGKMDIIKHNDVAKHFRVQSTPTIMLVKDGIRYNFDRANFSSTHLISFMVDILSFTVPEVNTTSELTALQSDVSSLFLIVHHEELDQDWHGLFMRQAKEKCLKAKFAYTTKKAIAEKLKLEMLPAIVALKDNNMVLFKESLTSYTLARWILTEKDVAFPVVNGSNIRRYLQPIAGRRLAILVVNESPKYRSQNEIKAMDASRKIALGRNNHKKFQILLTMGSTVSDLLLRRSVGTYPYFFVFEPYTALYYVLEGEDVSEESVSKFFENIVSGKEEPRGGTTYLDQIIHICQLANAVFQSMLFYRPYLSAVTGFCLCVVTCFYLYVCFCGQSTKESKSEIQRRKMARSRRRKELLEKKKEKEEEEAQKRIAAKEKAVSQLRSRGINSKQMQLEDEGTSYSESGEEDSPNEHLHED